MDDSTLARVLKKLFTVEPTLPPPPSPVEAAALEVVVAGEVGAVALNHEGRHVDAQQQDGTRG